MKPNYINQWAGYIYLCRRRYHSSTLTIFTIWMPTVTESTLIDQWSRYIELWNGVTENPEAAWIMYLYSLISILLSSDYILKHDKYYWQRLCHIWISAHRRQIFSIYNIHRMESIQCQSVGGLIDLHDGLYGKMFPGHLLLNTTQQICQERWGWYNDSVQAD
jgi:hypothetical protein